MKTNLSWLYGITLCCLALAAKAQNWSTTGNLNATPDTHFLGTLDTNALELRVSNGRVLRLEPNPTSPNMIGGYSGNFVTPGLAGATISGGGQANATNQVTAQFGTIGGGKANTVNA